MPKNNITDRLVFTNCPLTLGRAHGQILTACDLSPPDLKKETLSSGFWVAQRQPAQSDPGSGHHGLAPSEAQLPFVLTKSHCSQDPGGTPETGLQPRPVYRGLPGNAGVTLCCPSMGRPALPGEHRAFQKAPTPESTPATCLLNIQKKPLRGQKVT